MGDQDMWMLLAADTFPNRQQFFYGGQGFRILAEVIKNLDAQKTGC